MKRALLAFLAGVMVWSGNAPYAVASPNSAIIMVIDASRSMQGKRLEIAEAIGKKFLNDLPSGVKAGLVTFNSTEVNTVPLTTNVADVSAALSAVVAQGNTALYDGVVEAIELADAPAQTRLVVLTDGYDTSSSETAQSVEDAISESGLTVDVVAIAATDANLVVMKRFTDAGNGRVFQADDISKLEEVLSRALDQAAPSPIKSPTPTPSKSATPSGEPTQSETSPVNTTARTVIEMIMGPIGVVVALVTLCGYAFLALRGLMASRRKNAMYKSLEIYDPRVSKFGKDAGNKPDPFIDIDNSAAARNVPSSAVVSISSRTFPMLAERIERADMSVTPERWVTFCSVGFIGLFLFLQAITGAWFLAVIVASAMVYQTQNAIIKSRAAQHLRKFEAGLADFLVLIASGLRAGMSFAQSVESAASEGTGPVERQMRRALGEVRVGSTLEGALNRVADRMKSDDLRWSIAALQIQREVGGNLSKILDTAASTIRSRAELKREVQALSAEGQLSAYVLLALPISVFLFLGITRPEYIQIFWTQRIGLVMLGMFTLLVTAGWFWIKSIVKVEV